MRMCKNMFPVCLLCRRTGNFTLFQENFYL